MGVGKRSSTVYEFVLQSPKMRTIFRTRFGKVGVPTCARGWVGQPEKDREEFYRGSWHLADQGHPQTFRLISTTLGMSTCLKQPLGIFHIRLHV